MRTEPPETIEFLDGHRVRGRGRLVIWLLVIGALLLLGGMASSYYVDALWFGSLGYEQVFWRTLNIQAAVFGAFALATFAALYGGFLALKPARFGESGGTIIVNGRPVTLPVGPVLHVVAVLLAGFITLATATGMMGSWDTFALWWTASSAAVRSAAAGAVDPVFGRPIGFYLFTLPAWHLLADWLTTIAVIVLVLALFFRLASASASVFARGGDTGPGARGLAFAWALLLVAIAANIYLGRFDRLLGDHTIFSGVTYTEEHVLLPGALAVSVLTLLAAAGALILAFVSPRARWLIAAVVPAALVYVGTGVTGAYVNSFIVKPNELVREKPYITRNIAFTREAFALDRVEQRSFPAETTVEAANAAGNQDTLQNIRLWDWRALQDTLRQLQEIRTYYDFPDIDIDRYVLNGTLRQVMIGTRELNVEKLPVSSRNWINEKLIYTHGYGLTMNPVTGFTPEGLPALVLRDMPVVSLAPELTVKRPEVYFGETTNTDVYVKTRQQEFNYPQGQTNSLTSYEGTGGIVIGGMARRLLIAFNRGDLGKLPFSDDVTPDSRLLMRRNVRERVNALAPFLVYDDDPYMVLGDDGRLSWIMDGFTVSDQYPYSRGYAIANHQMNYVRNSVKVVIDAYDGTTTFYVFDTSDPIIAAWRTVFPTLFKDAAAMPADIRGHVRYPEMLLGLQADVFGLYHMTDPEVFYNREDLWTVASVAADTGGGGGTAVMEPNFVLMKLPGEDTTEFVEVLPFTPANRNNLIGWIAGRSDGAHYGTAIAYDFPKTRLIDGPMQIEARIDQNAQLSGQLSLWNQQGSRVRRGALLVIPIGRALLYAEAIYLQAERSPMPELRLVVLAMQDRLVYAPTFQDALSQMFGTQLPVASSQLPVTSSQSPVTSSQPPASGSQPPAPSSQPPKAGGGVVDRDALVAQAAQDLADYQRLTAEGKLAEAGQKLEHLKQTLDALNRRR